MKYIYVDDINAATLLDTNSFQYEQLFKFDYKEIDNYTWC